MNKVTFTVAGILTWALLGSDLPAVGQVLLHETFADANIKDGNPAKWSAVQQCFLPPCGVAGPLTSEVVPGEYSGDWSGYFMMQTLTELHGQNTTPDNTWSVRARMQASYPPGREFGPIALGIGLDAYFHVNLQSNLLNDAFLVTGEFADVVNSDEHFPLNEEYFVQMDVTPDSITGTIWPSNDPSKLVTLTRTMNVQKSRPVFYGDWNTFGAFREVIVSKSPLPLGGDYDGGGLSGTDVDQLSKAIRSGANDPTYNLNSEIAVNNVDLTVWVKTLKNTWFGDANLDGQFESGDLVAVFSQGTYDDGILTNATWSSGDWNADGEFDSGDLIIAFQDGGYGIGQRAAVAVPEPSAIGLLLLGLLIGPFRWNGLAKKRFIVR